MQIEQQACRILGLQFSYPVFRVARFYNCSQLGNDLFHVDRLGQIFFCPYFHRFNCHADVAHTGHHNDFGLRGILFSITKDFQAVDAGHLDVQHRNVIILSLNLFDGFKAVAGLFDIESFIGKPCSYSNAKGVFVICN